MSHFSFGLYPSISVTPKFPSIVFTESVNQSPYPSTATPSFTGVNFGSSHITREIFILVQWTSNSLRSLSSATIGGVSATLGTQRNLTSIRGTRIIFATLPTGSTGTVALTFSGIIGAVRISVFNVTDRKVIGAGESDYAATTNGTTSHTIVTGNITAPEDGFLISSLMYNGGTTNPTISGMSLTRRAYDGSFGVASSGIFETETTGSATWSRTSMPLASVATWAFE